MYSDDFHQMDDPAFLAERARVRETIEALQARMRKLNAEFDRRAGAKFAESGTLLHRQGGPVDQVSRGAGQVQVAARDVLDLGPGGVVSTG